MILAKRSEFDLLRLHQKLLLTFVILICRFVEKVHLMMLLFHAFAFMLYDDN